MRIQTTKLPRQQSARITNVTTESVDGQNYARVNVHPSFQRHMPEGFRAGGFVFPVDSNDPDALEAFAAHLEVTVKQAKARAQRRRKDTTPKAPPPSIYRQSAKVLGGTVGGTAVGFGVGGILQHAGVVARSSGNPYWNAFAVACGVAGFGAGLLVSSGLGGVSGEKYGFTGWLGQKQS